MNKDLYTQAMNAPMEYLDTIEDDILNEQDIHALIKQANQLEHMKTKYIQVLNVVDSIGGEETYDIERQVSAMVAKVDQLIKDCQKYIILLEDEHYEAETYGTYNDQVRDTYYGGQL